MATSKQLLGASGEKLVAKYCACPKCNGDRTLKRLPTNFKCADLICDFCGFLGQVKTTNVKALQPLLNQVLGAAWGPQKLRMDAGIFFPMFLVLQASAEFAIYYLSAELQKAELQKKLFTVRAPLSATAKRAGWQGFLYNLASLPTGALVRLK